MCSEIMHSVGPFKSLYLARYYVKDPFEDFFSDKYKNVKLSILKYTYLMYFYCFF